MSEASTTTSAQGADGRLDIAIIGGGAAGTLVATHLLSDPHCTLRVALIEPRPQPGQGVAYSTTCPEHLLNVVAARMGAFDDRPGDFVRFLREHPDMLPGVAEAKLDEVFAPRMLYGRYLHHLLESQPRFTGLVRCMATVQDVHGDGDGYRLQLDDGTALHARAVVLATGNRPAGLPLADAALDVAPGTVRSAWDYPQIAGIDADADVCVVGAGLSMVDVALTLARNGHRGRIEVLSRHGLAPLAHAVPTHGGVAANAEPMPDGVRARMRRIRADANTAMAAGQPWQWSIDALRRETQALWASFPSVEQRRFLRHAVRHWDIHRHRIAPEADAVIQRLRAEGRLHLHAGRLHSLSMRDGLAEVAWTPRDGAATQRARVHVVVDALGLEKRPVQVPGSLHAAMHARGLLKPGPHGIGVASIGEGAVLGTDGLPVPGLWTLGAARVGDLWESIAIPELRGQAGRVAAAARAFTAAPA